MKASDIITFRNSLVNEVDPQGGKTTAEVVDAVETYLNQLEEYVHWLLDTGHANHCFEVETAVMEKSPFAQRHEAWTKAVINAICIDYGVFRLFELDRRSKYEYWETI